MKNWLVYFIWGLYSPLSLSLFQQDPTKSNLWWEGHEVVEVLFKDIPLLDAGVNSDRLWIVNVLQRLLVGGGLAVDVHGKVGPLHFTWWRGRTAAGILGQMVKFVQRGCSTFQVLADPKKEVRVWGGNKRLAVIALRSLRAGRGSLIHRVRLRGTMVMMVVVVVVVSIPGGIHVLVTSPSVTVLILICIIVRAAHLYRLVLVELGPVHYREIVLGYASIHLDQVEHGDDICSHHELLGLRVLYRGSASCPWRVLLGTQDPDRPCRRAGCGAWPGAPGQSGRTGTYTGPGRTWCCAWCPAPPGSGTGIESTLGGGPWLLGGRNQAYKTGPTSREALHLETTHFNEIIFNQYFVFTK